MVKTIAKYIVSLAIMFWLGFGLTQLTVAQVEAKCYKFGREVPCEELNEELGKWLGLGLGFIVFLLVVGIASSVFWILMLIHVATKPIESKAMWIILMVFTGIVGALIYYFMVKRKFDKQVMQPPSTS